MHYCGFCVIYDKYDCIVTLLEILPILFYVNKQGKPGEFSVYSDLVCVFLQTSKPICNQLKRSKLLEQKYIANILYCKDT